ncbi:MAG: hypothetical protein HC809_12525 [Gammaproteobacteria bacterium]|nr:hypothetical protein [Gammaproteobacteria bacterium]
MAKLAFFRNLFCVVAIGTASDSLAVCTFGTSSEPTLQDVFDSILPVGELSATGSCLAADSDQQWTALGEAVATVIIELAGFADANTFGIYDVLDSSNRVTIFAGSANVGDSATIELMQSGSTYSVLAQGNYVSTFASRTFGFFLSTPEGYVFTSDPAHNSADGADHMYAYQGTGATFTSGPLAATSFAESMYLLAFEDLLIPQGRPGLSGLCRIGQIS